MKKRLNRFSKLGGRQRGSIRIGTKLIKSAILMQLLGISVGSVIQATDCPPDVTIPPGRQRVGRTEAFYYATIHDAPSFIAK
jgi:hypothetical protein